MHSERMNEGGVTAKIASCKSRLTNPDSHVSKRFPKGISKLYM